MFIPAIAAKPLKLPPVVFSPVWGTIVQEAVKTLALNKATNTPRHAQTTVTLRMNFRFAHNFFSNLDQVYFIFRLNRLITRRICSHYFVLLIIDVTNAAIDVVEEAILMISAKPTPFLGGFTGTMISQPGAAFLREKVLDFCTVPFIYTINTLRFLRP